MACALQAPPGRKGLKVLRTNSPRTPHAAAAVRKAAARLAFTGVVATAAASFAPPALAKGGGRGGGGSYSSENPRYKAGSEISVVPFPVILRLSELRNLTPVTLANERSRWMSVKRAPPFPESDQAKSRLGVRLALAQIGSRSRAEPSSTSRCCIQRVLE